MLLTEQVCSLELAKQLQHLGVKQSSLFYWVAKRDKDIQVFGLGYIDMMDDIVKTKLADYEYYSAFTVAELGKMLPGMLKIKEKGFYYLTMDCDKCPFYEDMPKTKEIYSGCDHDDDSEADARAKMLIYLIENKLITL